MLKIKWYQGEILLLVGGGLINGQYREVQQSRQCWIFGIIIMESSFIFSQKTLLWVLLKIA